MYLFNKIPNTYYVPDTELDPEKIAVNNSKLQSDRVLTFQ